MPMPTVNNDFYKEIGTSLEQQNNTKVHEYLYSQNYLKVDAAHPFDPITPLVEEFFGPRNLTLLIVSKKYELPNAFSTVALDKIKRTYPVWSKYKVYIWVDLVLALRILDASGNNTYYNAMLSLATQLEQICVDMKDYGFEWKGTLSEGKDAAYFQQYINAFYAEDS